MGVYWSSKVRDMERWVWTTRGTNMSGHDQAAHPHDHANADDSLTVQDRALVTDPVCGMRVDPATSKHRLDHDGRTFHFCSAGCRTKFAADPQKYLRPQYLRPRDAAQAE